MVVLVSLHTASLPARAAPFADTNMSATAVRGKASPACAELARAPAHGGACRLGRIHSTGCIARGVPGAPKHALAPGRPNLTLARNTNPNIGAAAVSEEALLDSVVDIDGEILLRQRILDYTFQNDTAEEGQLVEVVDDVGVEPLVDAPIKPFQEHSHATAAIQELAEKTNKLKAMLAEAQSWGAAGAVSTVRRLAAWACSLSIKLFVACECDSPGS